MNQKCIVCGDLMSGIFVPINYREIPERLHEKGFSITKGFSILFETDSIFTEADINTFGATNLAYQCFSGNCSACVCVKCKSSLPVGTRKQKGCLPFVGLSLTGSICPSCDDIFEKKLWANHDEIRQHLFIAGRVPTEVTCSGLEIDYHSCEIPIISKFMTPLSYCCLCMSSSVDHIYTIKETWERHSMMSVFIIEFPLCKSCRAIYEDKRLKIKPYRILFDKHLLQFINPVYAKLTDELNLRHASEILKGIS